MDNLAYSLTPGNTEEQAEMFGSVISNRVDLMELSEEAIANIRKLFEEGYCVFLATSFGKDSKTLVALAIEAARRYHMTTGKNPTLRLITSNTFYENPLIIRNAKQDSDRAISFCMRHGIIAEQLWASPNPVSKFLVQAIGGQNTLVVPGMKAKCTMDAKIEPMNRIKRKIAKLNETEKSVTLIGTRFSESTQRGDSMKSRKESWDRPWLNDDGFLMMSPIALWTTGHVFEFMNKAHKMPFPVFDDFANTLLAYEAMGDETCDITKLVDGSNGKGGGCGEGGRSGCWTCLRVSKDKSLAAIAKTTHPEFEPLVMFRELMNAGHYVIENRCWIGRELDEDGCVNVAANTYSREWQASLLRIAITLELDEQTWAAENNREPRFEVMPVEDILMIAFLWERYGLWNWSDAINIYQDVVERGNTLRPTQEMIDELYARNVSSKLFGDQDAKLKLGNLSDLTRTYEDVIGQVADVESHQQRYYMKSNNKSHSPLVNSETGALRANLGEEPDLAWFWINEHVREMTANKKPIDRNFLYRNGYIETNKGYHSELGHYQYFGARVRANDLHLYAHSPDLLRNLNLWIDKNPQQSLF